MKKIVLLLLTSLLFVPSCKDDDQTEPDWDPIGLYNVDAQKHAPNAEGLTSTISSDLPRKF